MRGSIYSDCFSKAASRVRAYWCRNSVRMVRIAHHERLARARVPLAKGCARACGLQKFGCGNCGWCQHGLADTAKAPAAKVRNHENRELGISRVRATGRPPSAALAGISLSDITDAAPTS